MGSSPEDGEFVPQYDNFQVFARVRPNAQDRELQQPPTRHVTQVSFRVVGCAAASSDFCTLHRFLSWIWALAGVALAVVGVALPVDRAASASMALMVTAMSMTPVQIILRRQRLASRVVD
jgi:hypothetical protein